MVDIKPKRLSEANAEAFSKAVDLDIRSQFFVLSAEYKTRDTDELHQKHHTRLQSRCKVFKEGQVMAYTMGLGYDDTPVLRPVGLSCSLRLDVSSVDALPATWNQITGNGMFTTHRPNGNTLVCAPISYQDDVDAQYIHTILMDFQRDVAKRAGAKKMIVLARAPGYERYMKDSCIENMTFEKYATMRLDKSLENYLRRGSLAKILPNGRADPASGGYLVVVDCSKLL